MKHYTLTQYISTIDTLWFSEPLIVTETIPSDWIATPFSNTTTIRHSSSLWTNKKSETLHWYEILTTKEQNPQPSIIKNIPDPLIYYATFIFFSDTLPLCKLNYSHDTSLYRPNCKYPFNYKTIKITTPLSITPWIRSILNDLIT